MSHIEIKKAKIKNGIFLAYEYVEKTQAYENKISTCSDAPIHEDLESAFNALVPHFALLTEETKLSEVEYVIRDKVEFPESLSKFKVQGFTLGGNGDTEGVVISGYKTLESGNVVNFNTPFQLFDDQDYEFYEELYNSIDHLKNEVYEYMNGKQAPRNHVGKLDFDSEDEEEAFTLPADNPIQTLLDGLPEGTTVEVSAGGKTKKLGKGKIAETTDSE